MFKSHSKVRQHQPTTRPIQYQNAALLCFYENFISLCTFNVVFRMLDGHLNCGNED